MLGIVHFSPMSVSVFIDRSQFKREHVTEAEARDGTWSSKVSNMLKQPKDGRERVLFVEKLSGLQVMLRGGFDAGSLKVVLFDDLEVLKNVPGVVVVDAKHGVGETWRLYQMLPDEFNEALAATVFGVPEEVVGFDQAVHEVDKIPVLRPDGRKKRRGLDSTADAIMASIIGGITSDGAAEPVPELTPEPAVAQDDDDPQPPAVATEPEPTHAAVATETDPTPPVAAKASRKPRKQKVIESEQPAETTNAEAATTVEPEPPVGQKTLRGSRKLF
jgi:hypothetical protein